MSQIKYDSDKLIQFIETWEIPQGGPKSGDILKSIYYLYWC